MASCFDWIRKHGKPNRNVKLVIIGLDDAGKSTTLASLEGEPPDGITPTIGFCNATLNFGKWSVTLYDLGGGRSVRSVWEKYYCEVYGIIFTVDSSNDERLWESRDALADILDNASIQEKPILILANKQDKEGALNKPDIEAELELDDLVKKHKCSFGVYTCSAIKGYGKNIDRNIKTGIEWLLHAIGDNYEKIHAKVDKETAIQKEKDAKERKERLERIRKLREEREKAAKEAGVEESEEEDDDVVTGRNPFKSIKEQIAETEKREKKAKEKEKKIKAFQAKKLRGEENSEQDENVTTPSSRPKKKFKKKKKKIKSSRDTYGKENDFERNPGDGACDDNENYESDDDRCRKPKSKTNCSTILENKNAVGSDVSEDTPSHTVIHVGSAENLKLNNLRKSEKNKKKNYIENDHIEKDVNGNDRVSGSPKKKRELPQLPESFDNNENDDEDHNSDNTYSKSSLEKYIEKNINDSRVELFQAKSSDSSLRLSNSDMNSNKAAKSKKKKKKFKSKSIAPLDDDNDSCLPPVKLEPIRSKGRLPEINKEFSGFPSWAKAKPNSEETEVYT